MQKKYCFKIIRFRLTSIFWFTYEKSLNWVNNDKKWYKCHSISISGFNHAGWFLFGPTPPFFATPCQAHKLPKMCLDHLKLIRYPKIVSQMLTDNSVINSQNIVKNGSISVYMEISRVLCTMITHD